MDRLVSYDGTFMVIRVLLFAAFREMMGSSSVHLEVPENSTAQDIFDTLCARQPDLRAMRPYTSFAVNRQVVAPSTALHQGDEVAFLQPASGGAA